MTRTADPLFDRVISQREAEDVAEYERFHPDFFPPGTTPEQKITHLKKIARTRKDEKMVKKINEAKEAISKYDQMLERDDSDVYIEPAPNSGNGGVMKNSRDNDSSRSNNGESKDEGNVDSANSPESNRDSGQGRGRRD